jgi:hypothetical protein
MNTTVDKELGDLVKVTKILQDLIDVLGNIESYETYERTRSYISSRFNVSLDSGYSNKENPYLRIKKD